MRADRRIQNREVVNGVDRDRYDRRDTVQFTVIDRKCKAVLTIKIQIWRIRQIRCNAFEYAVERRAAEGESQRTEFRIQARKGDQDRNVFVGRYQLFHRDWRIIDRNDVDQDRCGSTRKLTVTDREGKTVRTVIIQVRRVGRDWRQETERALCRLIHDRKRQRVKFRIRARERNIERNVFVSRYSLRVCKRRIVHRRYIDGEIEYSTRRIGLAAVVRHCHRNAQVAAEIIVRGNFVAQHRVAHTTLH